MAELFVTIPASGNAAFRWMQSPRIMTLHE